MSGSARVWAVVGVVALAGACWGAIRLADIVARNAEVPDAVEAHSLLAGEPLSTERYRATLGTERLARADADLAEAQRRAEQDPTEDNIIWHGRRLAYCGEFRRAIEVYTAGLEQYPDSYKLLRHRGQCYITVRQLFAAVQDLTRAAKLAGSVQDEIEPDGISNARNEPRSTLRGNIWYHLGLALYLQGDDIRALPVWRAAAAASHNDDTLCATAYWTYLTLRRLGEDEEAAKLLELIHADMDVIENGAYRDLLLMFKGEISPEALLEPSADPVRNATLSYGVGALYLLNGEAERARSLFRRIVQGDCWPAFGQIAAEAELMHMDLGN